MVAGPCTPCCAETQVTNVPGAEGAPGTPGVTPPPPPPPEAPVGAYSFLVADTLVPAIGANQSFNVLASDLISGGTLWMAVGQIVVFDGPATFQVVSITDDFNFIGKFLGYALDVAAGSTINANAKVSPSGTQPSLAQLSVVAAGTAYSLTNTAALLDFGTTDPSLVITSPGTWLLLARGRFDYVGATFAANRTVTMKLRRTNNAPADLTNGAAVFPTDIITTLSYPAWDLQTPPVLYVTANSDDIIQLFGDVSVVPTAGSLDAVAAQVIAIKLS